MNAYIEEFKRVLTSSWSDKELFVVIERASRELESIAEYNAFISTAIGLYNDMNL